MITRIKIRAKVSPGVRYMRRKRRGDSVAVSETVRTLLCKAPRQEVYGEWRGRIVQFG